MPVVSMGTTFKKAAGSAVASLSSIDGASVSADSIDTTTLDTTGGYRTFVTSLKDAGEISLSGYFTYSAHATFMTDFEANTSASYVITFPDAHTWTFTAIITAFSTSVDLEDLVGFECTLKISGKPVLA